MIPPSCRVLRDGTLQTIPAAQLVNGDVVLLVCTIPCLFLLPTSDRIFGQRVGDKTPADLLIFASTDLLTGESEPQERGHNHKGTNQRPVEAENLVRLVLSPTCRSSRCRRFSTRLWS